MTRHSKE